MNDPCLAYLIDNDFYCIVNIDLAYMFSISVGLINKSYFNGLYYN